MIEDVKTKDYWLMQGDCLERMKEIPDKSIQLVLVGLCMRCGI